MRKKVDRTPRSFQQKFLTGIFVIIALAGAIITIVYPRSFEKDDICPVVLLSVCVAAGSALSAVFMWHRHASPNSDESAHDSLGPLCDEGFDKRGYERPL